MLRVAPARAMQDLMRSAQPGPTDIARYVWSILSNLYTSQVVLTFEVPWYEKGCTKTWASISRSEGDNDICVATSAEWKLQLQAVQNTTSQPVQYT